MHSSQVSLKNSIKPSVVEKITSFQSYLSRFSSSINSSGIFIRHELKKQKFVTNISTLLEKKDPWQLLRNKYGYQKKRDLRLIIHGSKGGFVHPIINWIIQEVKNIRGTNVELEVLSAKNISESKSSSIWLVPLLLLPGRHVRNDIPKIRNRIKQEKINVDLIPFLGCWDYWLSILKYYISMELKISKPILIHHPLTDDIGSKYLKHLQNKINIPLIPWTYYSSYSNKKYSPIPFSLLPNANTQKLIKDNSISSLLEIDFFLFPLIHILSILP